MIYFVRHGQTEHNRQGYIQGHLDIPLNDEGIAQAHTTADMLKNTHIDMIYVSPLQRAMKTAEIINEYHHVKVVVDDRLKELNAGSLQGRKFKELTDEEKIDYFTDPTVFGAESYDDLYDRVVSVYKEIEAIGKDILIVSHGGVYRSIVRYIKNIADVHADLPPLENCAVVNLTELE